MAAPATTPKPPYYAVIFTSVRNDGDNGYGEAAKQMLELASKQPGFLGFETARQETRNWNFCLLLAHTRGNKSLERKRNSPPSPEPRK